MGALCMAGRAGPNWRAGHAAWVMEDCWSGVHRQLLFALHAAVVPLHVGVWHARLRRACVHQMACKEFYMLSSCIHGGMGCISGCRRLHASLPAHPMRSCCC